MTQIVVNFLQPNDVGSSQLATDPRIFDFEITPDAQAYYNYELTQILLGLGAQIKDSNGVLHAPTPTTLDSGTIEFTGVTPNANTVSDAINLLNNWTKMKQVNAQGFQTYSYGNFGITTDIEATIATTDANGVIDPNAPPNILIPANAAASGIGSLTTTMDQYMGQGLDKLIRALRAAGWDPIKDPVTSPTATVPQSVIDALNNVTAISTAPIYNLANVLMQAASAAAQTHLIGNAALTDSMSIQQVLMVDYVSRGNEILFTEMAKLRDAVDLNQQALSYLNSLQDLMNQKDPQKFIMQLTQLNSVNVNTATPQSQYDNFEKATYDQTLGTLSKIQNESPAGLQAYFNNLATGSAIPEDAQLAVGTFDDLATAGNVIASYSISQIQNNLTYLVQQIGAKAQNASGGLIQALNKVKADFSAVAGPTTSPNPNALRDWIQDTQKADEGGFQRNLSSAIVSSQSFNDTQRENLREVMFVFEEFYKSATGLLSRLTQLLEKMADGIAR